MLKKNSLSIILFLLFLTFGILIGIHIEALEGISDSLEFSIDTGDELQEVADLKKANEDMRAKINDLKEQVESYEIERATENIALKDLKLKVSDFRILAGHHELVGPGISITLTSIAEENIADIMEQKRYLVNLINELRMTGAEGLSINNYRITSRSEVTLAGNHINVNATAIAPPYVIKAIGNPSAFKRYATYKTLIFELMEEDGISTEVDYPEEILIPAVKKEKPVQFLQAVENPD